MEELLEKWEIIINQLKDVIRGKPKNDKKILSSS